MIPQNTQTKPIQIFMIGKPWPLPTASAAPFPAKLETWCRIAGLRYEVIVENNPIKGPKKKTPWIVDGSIPMGDTELIIQHLKARYHVDPDAHLDRSAQPLALAWHRLIEEHYHQVLEWALFIDDGGPERVAMFASLLPFPLRLIFPKVFVNALKKQLYERGLTRHSREEILKMGQADLDALSEFLGDNEYFLGTEPSTLDAAAFGFLSLSLWTPGQGAIFAHARSLPNLVAYCRRMRDRYFPDSRPSSPT